MAAKHALLMEIELPGDEQPLRLMTGNGFEVLRTDTTGREVYGIAHAGKEYLFFPFSFKPVDAGVLSVHLPPEYEESCLDHRADGARVVFLSTHGTPFFPDMPDEFKSNTGSLRVNSDGTVRILLNRLEPGEARPEEAGCGCGHHEFPAHDHSGGCHCHGKAAGLGDKELAALLRQRCAELNAALALAADAGLSVDMDVVEKDGRLEVRPASISRPL